MFPSFSFSIAIPSDVPEIIEFLLSDFLFNRSLNGAIGMTREEAHDRYLAVTESSVANGTSVVVRNKEGEVVGVRLSGFEDRQEVTTPVDLSSFPPRIFKIRKILTKMNEGKWALIPSDIDRLFEVKLISVAEKYRGQGIAKVLLSFGLDSVRERGAKGVYAEAVAIASQVLFDRAGYSVIREIVHEEWLDEEGKPVFVCPDGTKTVQLV
ncbi:hypothetical protein PENTCL1PPCAC_26774, partial [Pristionchus entomophagus]